jgi:isoleucyl-tRNA synthetase
LIIAEAMLEACAEKWNVSYEVVSKTLGLNLNDINLIHPFLNRKSVLLHADHVTTEAGTGCVHCSSSWNG